MIEGRKLYFVPNGRGYHDKEKAVRLAWMLLHVVFLSVSLPAAATGMSHHVVVNAPLIALTRVDLLDGTGSPVRRDQAIIVEKGIITTIGDTATTAIPADATILALPGRTVIPGIVGMHNHLHIGLRVAAVQSHDTPLPCLNTVPSRHDFRASSSWTSSTFFPITTCRR